MNMSVCVSNWLYIIKTYPVPPAQCIPGAVSLEAKQLDVKLATDLQLVLWSRICASVHPLAHTSSWHSA
jgi:hypothetical protein